MRKLSSDNLLGINFQASDMAFDQKVLTDSIDHAAAEWDDIVFATITGTPGHDSLNGTAGDDIIYGLAGADTIQGRGGNDELYGGANSDFLEGGNGNDILVGGPGSDYAYGYGGDDIFRIDPGDDTTFDGNVGMGGIDTILNASGADISYRILDFFFDLQNGDGIEFIDLGGFQIFGTSFGEDYRLGDIQLLNRSGDTDISTLFGDDTIEGAALQSLNYDLGAGNDSFTGVGDIADNVHGGSGNDLLEGFNGDDVLFGDGGNDVLRGRIGDDILSGGAGRDVMNGGVGEDTASYADANGRVIVNLSNGVTKQGHAIGDKFVSIENLIGSGFDDNLQGDNAWNDIHGGDGHDLLLGRGGRDYLFGEDGNDSLLGGGIGDFLTGGAGNDMLSGGTGRDRFIFEDDFGADVITDFEDNLDFINFSNHSGFNNLGDVTAAASQAGADVVIMLDANNMLTLENFTIAQLDAGDFIF